MQLARMKPTPPNNRDKNSDDTRNMAENNIRYLLYLNTHTERKKTTKANKNGEENAHHVQVLVQLHSL